MKPLAASLLDALDYDSSDDSDFEVGDASGKHGLYATKYAKFYVLTIHTDGNHACSVEVQNIDE